MPIVPFPKTVDENEWIFTRNRDADWHQVTLNCGPLLHEAETSTTSYSMPGPVTAWMVDCFRF